MEKYCFDCKKSKPLEAFNKHKSTRDGLQGYCRDCTKSRQKSYNEKQLTTEQIRRYNLKRTRNMSVDEFDCLLEDQFDACACCKEPFDLGKTKEMHVDHDYKCCNSVASCGKCTRGILCRSCNHLLGNAKDSIEVLLNAIEYLKKWEATKVK